MLSPLPLVRRAGAITYEAIRYGWPVWLRPLLHEMTEKPRIREVLPGVHHWTRVHPRIHTVVSSYYVEPAGVLIDPLVPREGLTWFEDRRPPAHVVMTIRHHLRDGERFAEAFRCSLRCHVQGLHEFVDGPEVQGFDFGDELAPGVTALAVDAISPDETALHLDYGGGAIAFGDGLTRPTETLRFVPDFLIGDEPERVKSELTAAFSRLLELQFDALLFAHGNPLLGGGKQALRNFIAGQG